MKKVILIAVIMLVELTYGQNINSLYTYESINGIQNETGSLNTNADLGLSAGEAYDTDSNKASDKTLTVVVKENKNYSSPIGLYDYESLSKVNKLSKKSVKNAYAETLDDNNESSRKRIVIRKAKTEVLVRYNGKYSNIKLIDEKGQEVKANFSEKYRGLIVPRAKKEKRYFLEVEKANKSKVFYHQVTL